MSHMKGAKSRIIDFLPNEANYRSRQRCPRCERSTVEVTELATMICYAGVRVGRCRKHKAAVVWDAGEPREVGR